MPLCLNMIVRNEADKIERVLRSVFPYISTFAILDTGSTDDTIAKIEALAREWGIEGVVGRGEFHDFSQARNDGLRLARDQLRSVPCDYVMLCDADMELVVSDREKFLSPEIGLSYTMTQRAGGVHYLNTRLVHAGAIAEYKGVTHEFLAVPTAGAIPEDVAYFIDHADGSNRKDKFLRDIRLLKQGLKDEPNNERYMFYLASSYRDAGKPGEAAKWFKRRVEAGGWDEEVWNAQVGYAHALKDMGDEAAFIRESLIAYNMRPKRAEPLYDLARHFRIKGDPVIGNVFANAAQPIPKPNDTLFVNDFVYKVGVREEMAITGFYVNSKRQEANKINDALSLENPGQYWGPVNNARANHYYYVEPIEHLLKWRNIPFTPPNDLVAMNPSVCAWHGSIIVNVRAVNYNIDDEGRYLIRGTDGTANAENPIDTRNFLLGFGHDPFRTQPIWAKECYRDGNMPVEFPLVTGFEDVRLIPRDEGLWSSATVRQLHADGNCEQVLSRVGKVDASPFVHEQVKRMLRQPRTTEKNWAPILSETSGEQLFMHRPGHIVREDGSDVVVHDSPILIDNLSGSSQVISRKGGTWIAVLHMAHALPNSHKRYYTHRFVEYTRAFRIKRLSLPFVFHDKVIEFCAGMCWNPRDSSQLILSYGFKDSEARIATIAWEDADRLLGEGHSYD